MDFSIFEIFTVSPFISNLSAVVFAFGLAFQIPVALTLLARAGLVNSSQLKKRRKYAIVIAFVVAAILTPPDPISQIGLGIPVLILYEISIYAVGFIEKKRIKE